MTEKATRIFTIGHSNQTLEAFLEKLAGANIACVADVRSAPMSRFAPQFNRDALAAALERAGLSYLYLGRELGGRPRDASLTTCGKPDYAKMAKSDGFRSGLAALLRESEGRRIALMCAERDPADCHRFHLISRALAAQGVEVSHIDGDGALESQADVDARVLAANPQGDLFG